MKITNASNNHPEAIIRGWVGPLAAAGTGGGGGGGGSGTPPWFNVMDPLYGATGDGTTDDTAAINAAIAALIAAGCGVLYFPCGTYVTTGGLATITVACTILGDGMYGISTVTDTSQTASLFTTTHTGVTFRDIELANTFVGTPSAGSAIVATNTTLNRYERVYIHDFYNGPDIEDSLVWAMHACHIGDVHNYGLWIRNTASPDGGDWSISDTWIGTTHPAAAAIRQESSGGGKLANVKINGGTGSNLFTTGYDLAIGTGAVTSILLFANVSVENVGTDAFKFATSGSGTFDKITMTGIEVYLPGNTGQAINASGTGLTVLSIDDNCTFRTTGTARAAISLTNVSNVRVGAARLEGFNAIFTSSGTSNVLDATGAVGAGVAITGTPTAGQVPVASSGTLAVWGSGGGTGPTDTFLWRPLLDGSGNNVVDGSGQAVMSYGPA